MVNSTKMFIKKLASKFFIKKFLLNLSLGVSALLLLAVFFNSNTKLFVKGASLASAQVIEGISDEYFPSDSGVYDIGDEYISGQPDPGNVYVGNIGDEYVPSSTASYIASVGPEYYPTSTYVSSIGDEYFPAGPYVSSVGPEYYPYSQGSTQYPTQYYYPVQYNYPTQYSYPVQYSYPTQYSYPVQYPSYPTQYPVQYPIKYPTVYPSYPQNMSAPSTSYRNNMDSYNDNYNSNDNDNANANSNSNSNDLNNENYNDIYNANDNYNELYSNNENTNNNYSNSNSESNSEAYSDSYSNSESNANANVDLRLNNQINMDNVNKQGQDQNVTINLMRASGGVTPTSTSGSYTDTNSGYTTRDSYTQVDQPRYSDSSSYYGNYSQPAASTAQVPNYYVQSPISQATGSAQPKVITVDGGKTATPSAPVKELPKTGLPFAAVALSGLLPLGAKFRKFKGSSKLVEENANFIWESRELGKS